MINENFKICTVLSKYLFQILIQYIPTPKGIGFKQASLKHIQIMESLSAWRNLTPLGGEERSGGGKKKHPTLNGLLKGVQRGVS